MAIAGAGLADVPTEGLKRLLSRLYDGTLVAPITHPRLLHAGLPDLVDKVEHLQGLDARSAQAVLVAVLAERAKKKASGTART